MRTIILPGFSQINKDWAHSVANSLQKDFPTSVYEWLHWQSGKPEPGWIVKEASRISELINEDRVNIIAKSIGTTVAMVLLKSIPHKIHKIVLCGIPVSVFSDFMENGEAYFEVLRNFPTRKLLVLQNEDDNFGKYEKVLKLLRSIDPNIKVVSKPRSDHEYPYTLDFLRFLSE